MQRGGGVWKPGPEGATGPGSAPRRAPDPSRAVGILAVGVPLSTIIGLTLTSATTSIDPAAHTLADTHAGGALLWIAGELVTLTALAALAALVVQVVQAVQAVQAVHWMHDEERAAARADRRLATISAARMGVSRPGARPA